MSTTKKISLLLLHTFATCLGIMIIFGIAVHASVTDPALSNYERKILILKKIFLGPEVIPTLFGLYLLITGPLNVWDTLLDRQSKKQRDRTEAKNQ